jgi:hypothetical protein
MASARGAGPEGGERFRLVDLAQILVEQVGRGGAQQEGDLRFQVGVRSQWAGIEPTGQIGEHLPGGLGPRPRTGSGRGGTQQHVPQGQPGSPARHHVEAHVGDPLRREMPGAEGEQRFADRPRHPGIHAVGEDVIELTQIFRRTGQIGMQDAAV